MSLTGMMNGYRCEICLKIIMTKHVDDGTTPMFLACRATPGCKGTAVSGMYRSRTGPSVQETNPDNLPVWEWYIPKPDDPILNEPGMRNHVDLGGLALRPPSKEK